MKLPAALVRTLHDVHEGAEGWLERFPDTLAALQARWRCRVTGLAPDLSYNVVAFAEGEGGERYVLKASPPSDEFAREAAALRHYDGEGACRLVRADEGVAAMLLERVTPGVSLWRTHDDDAATLAAAGLMQRLWRPAGEAHPFCSLASWTRALPAYLWRHPRGGGPLPHALVVRANAWREDLLHTDDATLLHADLHHGNILSADRAPYLAIDPKGVIGPRGYEVGPFLLNPLPSIAGHPSLSRLLERRIALFSEALRMDAREIAAWGVVHGVLSACWSLEDHGGGHETALEVIAGLERLQ